MTYKITYDEEADVLTIFQAKRGKFSYAEEMGNCVIHCNAQGKPLFIEILKASQVIPAMVSSLAQKKAVNIKL